MSNLWFRWREFASFTLRTEAVTSVRSIAKRLVLGHPAATERNDRPTAQAVCVPFGVMDGEFALDPNRAIINDGDFRGHAAPILAEKIVVLTYNCHRGY
jgi:hypothetical protein